jgi:toxin ParE1/3/4
VARFRFSRRAEADLLSIGDYTLRTWGVDQALRYIDDLEACCQMLADNCALGRSSDHIRPGLRRMESGRHVVFYREDAAASWFFESCTRTCFPNDTLSRMTTTACDVIASSADFNPFF